jgi:phage-related protein
MADRNGRIEIQTTVDNALQTALAGISSSVRSVLEVTRELNKNTASAGASANDLTKALSGTTSASGLHAKAVQGLIRNQSVLSQHFRNSAIAASELEKMMRNNTTATNQERLAVDNLVKSLKAQSQAREGIMRMSEQNDMRRQGDALNSLANRYSMAGMRMSMALTLPITGFMRSSFSSYKTLEKETARTVKLIGDSYTAAADVTDAAGRRVGKNALEYTKLLDGQIVKVQTLEGAMKKLGKELDGISMKYGISRELVQGLAGDFAEIGIESVEALSGLTDMTAAVEKLGNVDIEQSQEFIKSIFQTILRMKRETGSLEITDGMIDYGNAIAETRQQLALFNLLENKTQLSLKSTADAFPELTAAAVSFGLSMSEGMALVAPMVSAGFQLGASANSVKVSLQRMVDLTKDNSQMIETLRSNYEGFNFEAGVSIETIQDLTYAYRNMQKGDLGAQGTLEFFSSLFGVRQGPRMAVAIQNLAQFQDQLDRVGTIENELAKKLEKNVQQYARFQGLGSKFTEMKVKDFGDLGEVVRLSQFSPDNQDQKVIAAFSAAREQLGQEIAREAKRGNDILSKITTESGRAIFIGAIGNQQAQDKFKQEIEISLETVANRFAQAQQSLKALGRQVVPILGTILDALVPILMKINDLIDKMPKWSKGFLALGLIAIALLGPLMKMVGSITQFRAMMMTIKASGGFFGKIRSQTKEVALDLNNANSAVLRFKNTLTETGGKFTLSATAKEMKKLTELTALQAKGITGRRVDKLTKQLKLKPQADMSGLSPETVKRMQATLDPNFMGYRKDSDRDPNFPASVMTYKEAGRVLGDAFLAVLKAKGQTAGFDPSTIVKPAKPVATPVTITSAMTAGMKTVGGPGPGPTGGGSGGGGGTGGGSGGGGGTGGGGSPTGGRPSGAPSGTAAPAPAPFIGPPAPKPTTATLIPNPAIPANRGNLPMLMPKSQFDKKDMARAKLQAAAEGTSGVKAIAIASKESFSIMAMGIKKAPIETLRILAKNLDIAKATINGQVKPLSQISAKALRGILLDYIKGIKDGLVFGKNVVEEKKKKADVKARGAQAPPSETSAVTVASDEGTKAVQSTQAKKNKKAVKEQVKADTKAIESLSPPPLTQAPGNVLSSIPARARDYASTVQQMLMNSVNTMGVSAEGAFNALELVKKSADTYYFPKEKFLQLANILGIQLPPIFNEMGELTDKTGSALAQEKKSILKLIESMTKVVKVTKKSAIGQAFPELINKEILQFEAEVNRALAIGASSRKTFNFKNLGKNLKDSFSSAFGSFGGGDIFSTLTGKVASKAGAQAGDVDYTKIGFKDLGYQFKPSSGGAKTTVAKAITDMLAIDGDVTRWAAGLLGIGDKGLSISRELSLTTKRQLKALLEGVPESRAKSALIRREMTTDPGYQSLLSRQFTTPETEEGQARKLAKSPIDKMSETDYSAFNIARQKGINSAKKFSEQRKELFRKIAKDAKMPVEIIEKTLTAMQDNDGKLGALKGVSEDVKKKMKDSFKTVQATLKRAGISVSEALKQPALASTLIAESQQVLAKSGGMRVNVTRDQAADLAGSKDMTLKPIVDAQRRVTKETYNFDERLQKLLIERARVLQIAGLSIESKAGISGVKSSIEQISRELAKVATDQVTSISQEIEVIKGKIKKPQGQLDKAKSNIAKIKTFKGAELESEEAQAMLGGMTKPAYIEKQQAIINTAKIAIKSSKDEIEIRDLTIKAIEKEVEAQRKLLAQKAKEMLPGVQPRLITGPVTPFVTDINPPVEDGKKSQSGEYWKQVQPQVVEAITPLVPAATAVTEGILKAEGVLKDARERLRQLQGLKTDISGSQEGKPFAENAKKRVADAVKQLKVKTENIDLEIKKQQDVLDKAQADLKAVYQRMNAAGGGGAGTTSVGMGTSMLDPFGGLGGRKGMGPRAPRIGPNLAFIDKGETIGGGTSVYEQIRQSLNIPVDVMDQVINQLRTGYKDAEGQIRKPQAKIDQVGTKLTTQIGAGLDKVIEALRQNLQGIELTVENVRSAIAGDRIRQSLGKLADRPVASAAPVKVSKEAEKAAQDASVNAVLESIEKTKSATSNIFKFTNRPLRKLAEALNKKVVPIEENGKMVEKQIKDTYLKIDTTASVSDRKDQIAAALKALGVSVDTALIQAENAVKETTATVEATKPKTSRKPKATATEPAVAPPAPSVTAPIDAATVATKQTYAQLLETSSYWKKYDMSLKTFVGFVSQLKRSLSYGISNLSASDVNRLFATTKEVAKDANLTKVLLEKYGIDINQIVDQYRQAVVQARNNLVAGVKPVAPAPIPTVAPTTPPAATPQPYPFVYPSAAQIINTMKPILPEQRRLVIPDKNLIPTPAMFEKIDFKKIGSIFLKEAKTFAGDVAQSSSVIQGSLKKSFSGGLIPAMRNSSRALGQASVLPITSMNKFFKSITRAAVQASALMIGDVRGPLQRLALSRTAAVGAGQNSTAFNLVTKMQRGASIGAGLGNLPSNMGMLPTAGTKMFLTNIGALGGAVTAAGLQFGLAATKMSAQVSLSVLQVGLKLTPFGALMMSAATGIKKAGAVAGAAFTATATAAKAADPSINRLTMTIKGLGGVGAKTGSAIMGALPGAIGGAVKKGAGFAGSIGQGIKGAGSGLMGAGKGGVGSAISMLSYQFGMVGMIAGPVLTDIVGKIAAIPKVGGPLILFIMLIVGAFMFLKKTTKAWSDYSDGAITKFKEAWKMLKTIFSALLAPVLDFFASFSKAGDSTGGMKSLGETIGNIADKVLEYLPKIQEFVNKYIVPMIRTVLSGFKIILGAIGPIIKGIIDFVKIFVNLFKRDFGGAFDAVKSMFGNFKEAFIKILKGTIVMLAPLIKLVVTLFFKAVGLIINILEQIPIFFINAIRWMAKTYVNLWFTMVKATIKYIDIILGGVGGLIRSIGGAFSWIPGLGDSIKNAANSIGNGVGGAMDVVAGKAQSAQNAVLGAIDGMADKANSFIGSASNIANVVGDKINSVIDGLVEDNLIPKGIGKKGAEELIDAFKDPTVTNAGGKAIGDALKKGVEEAMKSLNESFFNAVVGNLSDAIKKASSEVTEILQKQKDDALKAYDDQIEGINALAEAEERLTATEEYEADRRRRIRERELQRNNYQKDRALAIYQGRVDDARNLDLQELKNADDFTKELSDFDKGRQKTLQSQNRADAITIIKNNKEAASKLFEESIKEFEEYVEEVTRNGTISETQLTEQWGRIAAKANLTSTSINDDFKKSFENLGSSITSGLDPSTSESGFFSVEMGKLVETARKKFGIDTGINSQDAGSVLGITSILLSSPSQGIPAAISTAFGDGGIIQSTYGTGLASLSTYLAKKNDASDPTSLQSIFQKAIADANTAMEQELLKGQRGIGSAFDKIIKGLNDKVKDLAIAEGIKKGMEEAAKAAAEGAKDVVEAARRGASSASSGGPSVPQVKPPPVVMGPYSPASLRAAMQWVDSGSVGPLSPLMAYLTYVYQRDGKTGIFKNVPKKFNGGILPYAQGGFTFGPSQQAIPAILHGGEFVLRNSSVKKYGLDMLNQMNKGIYTPKKPMMNVPMPSYVKISNPSGNSSPITSESTHNYNIYVDNFIGETEWFNSMMKDYNMKVVPASQKQAGLESRIIKTYNGINRGM